MKRLRYVLAGVIAVGLLAFVFWERSEEMIFPIQSPIVESRASSYTGFFGYLGGWDQDVWIKLAKDTDPTTLLDFRVFGKLRPDRDPEARFGKAIQTRTDDYHMSWYRYSTSLGYAEAGCEKRMSAATAEEVAKAPCFPVVYGYTEQPIESVFHEPLLTEIRTAKKWKSWASWRSFVVVDSDGNSVLYFSFKGDHLNRIGLSKQVER